MATELEQLRQEAEQLKVQIRVSTYGQLTAVYFCVFLCKCSKSAVGVCGSNL